MALVVSVEELVNQARKYTVPAADDHDSRRRAHRPPPYPDSLVPPKVLSAFTDAGGRLLHMPLVDSMAAKQPHMQLRIRATDVLLPVCIAGQNRSQVAYKVAIDIKAELAATADQTAFPHTEQELAMGCNAAGAGVWAPHGALNGFDPHPGEESYGGLRGTVGYTAEPFRLAFNAEKVLAAGETQYRAVRSLPDDTRDAVMREQFNKHYFGAACRVAASGRRVILITFGRAAKTCINRFVEILADHKSAESPAPLKNVIVVGCYWRDTFGSVGSEQLVAYRTARQEAGLPALRHSSDMRTHINASLYQQLYLDLRKLMVPSVPCTTSTTREAEDSKADEDEDDLLYFDPEDDNEMDASDDEDYDDGHE